MEVTTVSLTVATSNKTGLVAYDAAMCVSFDFEHPLDLYWDGSSRHVCTWNHTPRLALLKARKFESDGKFPLFGIRTGDSLIVGARRDGLGDTRDGALRPLPKFCEAKGVLRQK